MTSANSQPGILAPLAALGRSLTFRLVPNVEPDAALRRLRDEFAPEWGILGIGEIVPRALGRTVPGLRTFPALSGPGVSAPSTQQALWIFLLDDNRSEIFDRAERIAVLLDGTFVLNDALDTFKYREGRDLTGYEDGTENPKEEAAVTAAIASTGIGLAGSSFAAVQRWVHDLRRFQGFAPERRDNTVGRRIADNEEIEDAPETAHVKRSAQESYDPEAFMMRRSMPWVTAFERGLEFIAYGESLDRFERVLRRMMGLDDGVVDALFDFSRPVTGGYYWCPPLAQGRLDLQLLGKLPAST